MANEYDCAIEESAKTKNGPPLLVSLNSSRLAVVPEASSTVTLAVPLLLRTCNGVEGVEVPMPTLSPSTNIVPV
jgi:hypothetical protein